MSTKQKKHNEQRELWNPHPVSTDFSGSWIIYRLSSCELHIAPHLPLYNKKESCGFPSLLAMILGHADSESRCTTCQGAIKLSKPELDSSPVAWLKLLFAYTLNS